jgi:large subunit ribosomal protein L9
MAKDIAVILLEDIGKVGRAGDIVQVSDGYARNFLFPQGKAALATNQVREQYVKRKAHEAAGKQAELEQLQAQGEQLTGTELTLTAKIKDGNDIYGSITKKMIAEELNRQASLGIKPAAIMLAKPIIKTGSQDITVKLSPDVETTIRVTVLGEDNESAAEED